jgi:uncharacterized protein YoxC
MSQLFNRFKLAILSILVTVFFLSFSGLTDSASALVFKEKATDPINPTSVNPTTSTPSGVKTSEVKVAPPVQPAAAVPNPFQKVLTKTQTEFDKALAQANQVFENLAQQLEQVNTEPDAAVRKQLGKDLENKQDDLEDIADDIDDLAEDLQSFNSKLLKTTATTDVSPEFQTNAQNAQLALEKAAKVIDTLADDVEKAKKTSTPAFRSLIDQEIASVQQSLEAATQAVKLFVSPS